MAASGRAKIPTSQGLRRGWIHGMSSREDRARQRVATAARRARDPPSGSGTFALDLSRSAGFCRRYNFRNLDKSDHCRQARVDPRELCIWQVPAEAGFKSVICHLLFVLLGGIGSHILLPSSQ
jgi:hypothetical protein